MNARVRLWRTSLLVAGVLLVAWPAFSVAILQLRVLEGDGAVYAAGSKGTRGITVQVTDETGRPIEGATVSFTLPRDGAGGTFADGLKTAIVTTKADGRASVWGMQWNRTPGQFDIRITAAKGHARAGVICQQYLSDKMEARSAGGSGTFTTSHHIYKWLLVGLAAGGGALGAMAFAQGRIERAPSAAPTPPPSVGVPVITIGRP